ncbi:MAG: hypothetical protein CL681_01420 [Blastopirellula sp.]|nr:hypothetical protein [Blastopirellula sp.]
MRPSYHSAFHLTCLLLLIVSTAEAQTSPASPTSREDVIVFGASVGKQMTTVARYASSGKDHQLQVLDSQSLGFPGRAAAYHPQHRLLYVVPNGKTTPAGHRGSVFAVDAKGKLTKRATVPLAHGYDYLSLDPTGRYLLGASYFEGHVDVYQLNPQGLPGKVVATRFEGRDKAHSVRVSPNQRFAYVPYVKDQNALYQYAFDAKTGALTPLDPPQAPVADDVGPRHLAYHPRKPLVLFSNEQQLGVSSYRILPDGRLELVHLCPAPGADPQPGLAASDIVITPDGRFAYASVRGFGKELNAVYGYAIQTDGKLQPLGKTDTDTIPWALALSPSGRTLFVSATQGGTLTAYQVQTDGGLQETAKIPWGKDFRDLVVTPAR